MRNTHKTLISRVFNLNMILGRPIHMFSPKVGEANRCAVGHIALDKNSQGYELEEIIGEGGGTAQYSSRMSCKDMSLFIDALIRGVGLRNLHLGEQLMQHEVSKVSKEIYPLYSNELRVTARDVWAHKND